MSFKVVKKAFLYLLAGGLFVLGFAPFGYWPCSVVAMAILLNGWFGSGKVETAGISFAFGIGQFLAGVSWIYVSMVNFGHLPPAFAVVAVVLVALFLASYPLLAGVLFSSLKSNSFALNALLIAPVCWILLEALRGYLFTGFPWLLLGYSAVDTWLIGFAPLGGVLLLSLVLCMVAACVALLWRYAICKQFNKLVLPSVVILILFIGGQLMAQVQWVKPSAKSLSLGLVQLNIPLSVKWQEGMQGEILDQYLAASSSVMNEVDLLIWPEGALPQFRDQISDDYLQHIDQLDAKLLFGTLERRPPTEGKNREIYNSMVLRSQTDEQFYRKRHLVPFGEFFPLKWLLSGLLAKLQVPMSEMTSWPAVQPELSVNNLKLLPTICYEDAFPEDWRAQASSADALVNISEDAWFGDSFAPHQRLEMGRMRSIETGREMIRVSNSGLSTIVRVDGSYRKITPQFEAAVMMDKVQAYRGDTPYVKWGRTPIYLFCFLVLIGRLFLGRSKYKHRTLRSK